MSKGLNMIRYFCSLCNDEMTFNEYELSENHIEFKRDSRRWELINACESCNEDFGKGVEVLLDSLRLKK
jgi:hypothetical protein